MTIVVYIGIAQAIFLSGLLLTKNKKLAFDYILLSWLVLNAVQLFYFNISFTRTTEQYNTPILIIGGLLQLLVAPLLFFYVRALVIPKPFQLRHHAYHFIPFVIQVSAFLYFYFFKANEVSIWVSE